MQQAGGWRGERRRAADRSDEPIIRASFVERPTYSGLAHALRRGRRPVSGGLLRSRRAFLRARFRDRRRFGRHPVQCGAQLRQSDGLAGTRRRLVAARLVSGHAGSPAAPLARFGEHDVRRLRACGRPCGASEGRCRHTHRPTAGCEAGGRARAESRYLRRRARHVKRQRCAASRTGADGSAITAG